MHHSKRGQVKSYLGSVINVILLKIIIDISYDALSLGELILFISLTSYLPMCLALANEM